MPRERRPYRFSVPAESLWLIVAAALVAIFGAFAARIYEAGVREGQAAARAAQTAPR